LITTFVSRVGGAMLKQGQLFITRRKY